MNKCSFLDHESSFSNAILSGLITLNTLKIFGPCPPLKPHQGPDSDPNYNYSHDFFPYKTESSSTKQTLVEVLG